MARLHNRRNRFRLERLEPRLLLDGVFTTAAVSQYMIRLPLAVDFPTADMAALVRFREYQFSFGRCQRLASAFGGIQFSLAPTPVQAELMEDVG